MKYNLRREAEVIFQQLVDEPPDRQDALLAERCGQRDQLRLEVSRLLAASDEHMSGFMSGSAPALESLNTAALPDCVGRYRIERQIGEGGMGLVFAARQENPDRSVALKLLRPGLVHSATLRRFQHEVEALASLQHEGIAHIYEAGTTEFNVAGRKFEQPFFAMELVDGEPITTYARRHRLDVRAKIELLLTVCNAVQYAHQKGIIHRDLKPANILVDSSGRTKVLDFGVARAASPDAQSMTQQTEPGQLVGTLAYMSPEQLSDDREHLDTRTDVYSLGIVAFELLAGTHPYEVAGKSIATTAREIMETAPAALSSMNRTLRGDLDTILAKALEKEPTRRYASVDAFADDFRRFLRHEPIAARPPNALYQIRKFSRRNRGLVLGVCTSIVLLVIGGVVSIALAVERGRALRDSEQQKRIAEAVNDFLTEDLLASADPDKQPDRNISLRQVLDRAAGRIQERFTDQPLVEASIRTTLSNTYKALGEYNPALEQAVRALELMESSDTVDEHETIRAMNRVASMQRYLGKFEDAETRFRAACERSTRLFGPEDETTLSILNNLALLLERDGRPHEAAEILESVVAIRTRVLGEQHERTMTSINNLALVYVALERYDEAEPLYLKELEFSQRVFGPEHPGTLISLNNLAVMYIRRGEPTRAEPLVYQVLEARERILGSDHPNTIESLETLGRLFAKTERLDEAEEKLVEALERGGRTLGVDHPLTRRLQEQLALLHAKTKHPVSAAED